MARRNSKGNGGSPIVRLTSLFPTKSGRGRGRVGNIRGQYFDRFMEDVVEKANSDEGIVFFVRQWPGDENPTLSAAVSHEQERRGERRPERGSKSRGGYFKKDEGGYDPEEIKYV